MEKNIKMDRDPKEEDYGYPPMWDSGYAKYWLKDIADKKNIVDYYYFKEVFGKEELKYIHTLAQKFPIVEPFLGDASEIHGDRGGYIDHTQRVSKVRWIPKNEESQWLYTSISEMIYLANNEMFQLDIWGVFDSGIQYTVYDENGAHYDWHMDIGVGKSAMRKISITILLSEPDVDFEGGDLQFMTGNEIVTVDRTIGGNCCVLFPSFHLHRITPVTAGIRKSLVFWCTGPPWK
jgi:PKHD-type hydroxylase